MLRDPHGHFYLSEEASGDYCELDCEVVLPAPLLSGYVEMQASVLGCKYIAFASNHYRAYETQVPNMTPGGHVTPGF